MEMSRQIEYVVCADGFKVSVQAGRQKYCSPASEYGPWSEFELGFPNREEPRLLKYIETGSENPLRAVYPYVPVVVVREVIAAHGGTEIDWERPAPVDISTVIEEDDAWEIQQIIPYLGGRAEVLAALAAIIADPKTPRKVLEKAGQRVAQISRLNL
jgi:hypothetical protein